MEVDMMEAHHGTGTEAPHHRHRLVPLHVAVSHAAERLSTHTAVVEVDGTQWTYAEVDRCARHAGEELARVLGQKVQNTQELATSTSPTLPDGVKPGERCVLLCVDEGAAMVVGILAALHAGAFFVPLEPLAPHERFKFVLQDCGAEVVLCFQAHADRIRACVDGAEGPRVVCIEHILPARGKVGPTTAAEALRRVHMQQREAQAMDTAAYAIYTSGSTGTPKGVIVEHEQMAAFARAKAKDEGLGVGSRVLIGAAFTFDLCEGDVFAALMHGATVLPLPRDALLHDLHAVIQRFEPTHLTTTPSLWGLMRGRGRSRDLHSLISLDLGGEPMSHELVREWHAQGEGGGQPQSQGREGGGVARKRVLRNIYGATECTVHQTRVEVMQGDSTPLNCAGVPLSGFSDVLVVKAWPPGEVDPVLACVGEKGEIFLGGRCVARGYINRPDLTREKFRLTQSHGRLYQTGDMGYLTLPFPVEKRACDRHSPASTHATAAPPTPTASSATRESLSSHASGGLANTATLSEPHWVMLEGRIDNQVKVNGQRVELGEIENVLAAPGFVDRAAVCLRKHTSGAESSVTLEAFVVLRPTSMQAIVDHNTRCGIGGAAEALDSRATEHYRLALRSHTRSRLPQHMRPASVHFVRDIPLTHSGKVNRQGLLSHLQDLDRQRAAFRHQNGECEEADADRAGGEEALSPMEALVADIWKQVLGVDQVRGEDSFTAMGGDSLSALRASRMLRERTQLYSSVSGDGRRRSSSNADDDDGLVATQVAEEQGIALGEAALFVTNLPMRTPVQGSMGTADDQGRAKGEEVEEEEEEEPPQGQACLFGVTMGPRAPCELMDRPTLRDYAAFLTSSGVVVRLQLREAVPSERGQTTALVEAWTPPNLSREMKAWLRALCFGCAGEDVPLVRTLLAAERPRCERGSDIPASLNPLHATVVGYAPSDQCVEVLLRDLVASGFGVNSTTEAGTSALHLSAAAGRTAAVSALVDLGADLARQDRDGQTPLHLACRAGALECVRALCRSHQGEVAEDMLSVKDRWERTPVEWASLEGHRAVVSFLEHEYLGWSSRESKARHRRRKRDVDMSSVASMVGELEELVLRGDASLHGKGGFGDEVCGLLVGIQQLICTNVANREAVRGLGLIDILARLLVNLQRHGGADADQEEQEGESAEEPQRGALKVMTTIAGVMRNLPYGNEQNRLALCESGCVAKLCTWLCSVVEGALQRIGPSTAESQVPRGDPHLELKSALRKDEKAFVFLAATALCTTAMTKECARVIVDLGALPAVDLVLSEPGSRPGVGGAPASKPSHPGLKRLRAAAGVAAVWGGRDDFREGEGDSGGGNCDDGDGEGEGRSASACG